MKSTALVLITLLLGACGSAMATVEVLQTPEPGTIGLLGLGLAGMGVMAWRRRK